MANPSYEITTRVGPEKMQVLGCHTGATKDIIIAARELARMICEDGLTEGTVENVQKDYKWSVMVRR